MFLILKSVRIIFIVIVEMFERIIYRKEYIWRSARVSIIENKPIVRVH
jgi:hypothetical protein